MERLHMWQGQNVENGLQHLHTSCPLWICPFPIWYLSLSAILNKPVLDLDIVSHLSLSPGGPPSCIPCQSNGIFSYQAAYQIQIPMMDKSPLADALEWRLLLSINVLPDDCVLLERVTLRHLFGGPAELQGLRSLRVRSQQQPPFWNPCSPG